ncbi:MAG: hypothetical protein JXR89_08015 [Deltaproteobacteria bacterium]|nr:hypothetical protein [Deltaproteobacteria bacterium]
MREKPKADDLAEDMAEIERFNDPAWMQKTLGELDDNLESVTEELKKSYVEMAAGALRIEDELKAAFEAGDEMAYQAARIKKNMILERLRELEALQL